MSGAPNPKMNDFTPMPIGKFKDKPLSEVPDWNLIWLWEQPWLKKKYPALYDYIENSLYVIQTNYERKKNGR